MSSIKLKYGLDEKPPLIDTLLYGLQWLAISLPTVIIIGKVVAGLHFSDPGFQVNYMQKLFFVVAISLLSQLFFGHKLPLILGPATVLLVGIVASQSSGMAGIYSSIVIGGTILALLSITGLFAQLERLFTSRVVAAILILIAFTLTPTILKLILTVPQAGMEFFHFCFALLFVLGMFLANKLLTGIWKSTLIIWALIAGSLIYMAFIPDYQWFYGLEYKWFSNFLTGAKFSFSLDIGVLVSFLICFLALSINDLGSIQSVGRLINPANMNKRITAGIAVTGLSNMLAGFLNVIGTVNFSLSTGIIAANGIASRFTLIPAGIGLLLISFLPQIVAFIGNIPSLIIGIVLLYIMCSQIAAGLIMAFSSQTFTFEDGLILGLPLMLGIIVSFLPSDALGVFPPLLVPIVGNGFVVGTLAALLMEHVIYRKKEI
ncbi:MAG: solute carrier family 23 protein [Desulfotomaculaceae bacterium]|nr:solute carrier family 23 protein [Desulfotomaculaceae bacterium]